MNSSPPTSVIAGLGNPGPKYAKSRHNLGYQVLDSFAEELGIAFKTSKKFDAELATGDLDGHPFWLLKPSAWMNHSGEVLAKFAHFYKLEHKAFTTIHDDITLEPAQLKISTQGGDGGHNGLADIIARLGANCTRVRIGIGNSPEQMKLSDWVLGGLTPEEQERINGEMPRYCKALRTLLKEGSAVAMNQFNTKIKTPNTSPIQP